MLLLGMKTVRSTGALLVDRKVAWLQTSVKSSTLASGLSVMYHVSQRDLFQECSSL
jgi:hypothetical protein